MANNDEASGQNRSPRNKGVFKQGELSAMLEAFSEMSLHDQAAIHALVFARAKSHQQKRTPATPMLRVVKGGAK